MGSSSIGLSLHETELSAEGVGLPLSPLFSTPSPTSLDIPYKKVGQFGAIRCKKSRELYFVCKHGHVVHREVRCNSRFVEECPYCGSIWRKKTVKRYSKCVSKMKNPKLVTLTLKKGGKNKLGDLPQLVHRFRKYLRRKGYKIKKFVSCLDPPNHVHGVWDVNYIPQHQMSQIWEDVTKDSFVVDVRVVDKHRWRGAIKYISKYITKISRIGTGMKRLHIINSWGNVESRKIRMKCKECGSYFSPLWDLTYAVDEYVDVEYVDVDYG